ncbi:hypothetical protein [Kiloniella sp. b19]|uniref:hypothetical protein n=1 Tax=Kiloniella sp. GXU_MW_B19 TaxID=3141326 RepID=UPI0031DB818D
MSAPTAKPSGAKAPFFMGWASKPPKALRPFLWMISALLIGLAAGAALSISSTVNNPGDGGFVWGQPQKLAGVVQAYPYPLLRLPADADHPEPRTMLLAGQGKRGAQKRAEPLNGLAAEASGVLIKRGDIDMLQVGGKIKLRASQGEVNPAADSFVPADPVPLGRWKLNGEICDGKCYQGAMRPGQGLAHKACANLCLIGGAPPVFVSTAPVDGSVFFLLADQSGQPLPQDWLLDSTAVSVSLEGEVTRLDNILIFAVDTSSLQRL